MAESLQFSIDLPVSTERVYRAWLDSYEHARFTGQPAQVDPRAGGDYSAANGEIRGKMLVMTPFSHIVQTWRDASFPPDSPDSQVDIRLEPTCLGSQLTLNQSGIPDGHTKAMMARWETDYFRPLLAYFEALIGESTADMDG